MKLVFIDCETTSLRPDRRAWNVALIVRGPDGDTEFEWFIQACDLDLGNADLSALKIGRYWDRHPQASRLTEDRYLPPVEADVLVSLEVMTRGATLLGSNPSFDTETIGARMRANGICPSWHYHSVDVPTLALGWLIGRGVQPPYREDGTVKSDDIARVCGVDPGGYERHTALGDCRLFRDLYDVVTDAQAVPE